MSGETEREVSGWTVDTLRAYMTGEMTNFRLMLDERDRRYQQRFEAQETSLQAALEAAEKATSKAETASERRFESINEFRGQLADQAATLMPRAETQVLLGAIAERLSNLELRVQERAGALRGADALRAAIFTTIGLLIAALAVVVVLVK